MKIRACTGGDFEQVYDLLPQLWPGVSLNRDSLKAVFSRALKSRRHQYLCAVDEGIVVGFCSLSIGSSFWQQGLLAHLDEIVVDKKHRGQGIGSKLMERAVAAAKAAGCARVELDSAFYRKAAHRFYEEQGFDKRAYVFSKALS
jgi:GNAT superfamily N-acetyltransferase